MPGSAPVLPRPSPSRSPGTPSPSCQPSTQLTPLGPSGSSPAATSVRVTASASRRGSVHSPQRPSSIPPSSTGPSRNSLRYKTAWPPRSSNVCPRPSLPTWPSNPRPYHHPHLDSPLRPRSHPRRPDPRSRPSRPTPPPDWSTRRASSTVRRRPSHRPPLPVMPRAAPRSAPSR